VNLGGGVVVDRLFTVILGGVLAGWITEPAIGIGFTSIVSIEEVLKKVVAPNQNMVADTRYGLLPGDATNGGVHIISRAFADPEAGNMTHYLNSGTQTSPAQNRTLFYRGTMVDLDP